MEVIVKKYEHFNRSLDVHVKNKDHYDRLMKEGGYVSYEKAQQMSSGKKDKPYALSKNGWDIIKAAKSTKDKNGNVKLSDKTIDAMIKIGAMPKKTTDKINISSLSTNKGGFSQ